MKVVKMVDLVFVNAKRVCGVAVLDAVTDSD
jgi:hypothetical protein